MGIVVLFVAILGQGSAGKAMMRAEMPGPTKEGSMPRMQQTALIFAGIYIGLNAVLTLVYMIGQNLPPIAFRSTYDSTFAITEHRCCNCSLSGPTMRMVNESNARLI